MLASKLADLTPLLKMLSDPRPTRTNPHGDDHFRHRLALAALCLPEIHPTPNTQHPIPNTQLAALFDSLTTSVFTLWWQHGMNSSGDAVPHLTRVLPALGQVQAKIDAIPLATHLARLLTDADGDVRWVAADAVRGMGSAAATPEILALLARLLTDADRHVRRAAAGAVRRFMAQDVRIFKVSKLLRKKWEGRSVAELSQ